MGKFLRFLAGKEVGAFGGVGGKFGLGGQMRSMFGAAKQNPISKLTAHNAWNAIKINMYMGVPLTLLTPGTPEEKMQSLAINLGTAFMTMGMNSPWRQFGWSAALNLMPHFGSVTRGIVSGYRGALESRTSVAIPFSHSTLAMDQAFATMQYSKQRMQEGYSNVGSEATFFAARYMAR